MDMEIRLYCWTRCESYVDWILEIFVSIVTVVSNISEYVCNISGGISNWLEKLVWNLGKSTGIRNVQVDMCLCGLLSEWGG